MAVIAGVGLVGALSWFSAASAVEETARVHKAPKKTSTSEGCGDAIVERRLQEIMNRQEEILRTQQTILQKFDAVMEELRIIKVRASAH